MTHLRRRVLVAAFIGVLAAGLTLVGHYPTGIRTDFDALWVAGHAWTHGQDPFAAARAYASRPPGYDLLYPATTILLTAPFTVWPLAICLALWSGLGFGALAFAVTGRTWWGLLALASPFALHAFFSVQWSPVLVASATLPWLAFLWIAKPSVGAALFAAYPSRRVFIAGIVVVLAAFVMFPSWVAEWRAALGTRHHLIPLFLRPGGWLLLLAWLRWRTPEGRLLGTLAIVPHTVMPYDMLTLAVLLRTRLEWIGATVLAWVSYLAVRTWAWIPPSVNHDESIVVAWPWWLALCYLPALTLVLTRRGAAAQPADQAAEEVVGTGST
jgi:SAM-dependent methyltransferase